MHTCDYKVFKKITLIPDLLATVKGCAATIGNFDGLHQGHCLMIQHLVKKAKASGLKPIVVTFEPSPQAFFAPLQPFLRLTTLRQKLDILAKLGVEQVVCLRFNAKLAAQSPVDFIKNTLVNALQIKYLMVGEDFRFGCKQTGDVALLKKLASQYDFVVEPLTILKNKEHKISSTNIRMALIQGNIELAADLLGRPFSIAHRVIHGEKLGRTLNFPTANLPLNFGKDIFKGVFVTQARVGRKKYYAVTNVGTRPTVDGKNYLAEVHILDFSEEIYGKYLTVEFLHKIRDEKRFDNISMLKQQIHQDIQEAKVFLKNHCLEPEYEKYD